MCLFSSYMRTMASLGRTKFKYEHFYFILLLFIFSSPKINPFKIHYSSTSPPWTLLLLVLFVFPTIAHLFCPFHCKTRWTMSADNISLQTYLSRDLKLTYRSRHVSLGENWSGPETSSTTNHKFHRALGRLHTPPPNMRSVPPPSINGFPINKP